MPDLQLALLVWGSNKYYRGRNNYQYYFGAPYHDCSIKQTRNPYSNHYKAPLLHGLGFRVPSFGRGWSSRALQHGRPQRLDFSERSDLVQIKHVSYIVFSNGSCAQCSIHFGPKVPIERRLQAPSIHCMDTWAPQGFRGLQVADYECLCCSALEAVPAKLSKQHIPNRKPCILSPVPV